MTEPDAVNLFVAGNARVLVGPADDTGLPTSVDDLAGLGTADNFVELGYTTEDGEHFIYDRTMVELTAHQAFGPIRRIVSEVTASSTFTLREWTQEGMILAYGGGTFAGAGSGWLYQPPDPSEVNETSLVLAWADDLNNVGLVIPRGMVTGSMDITFGRTESANFPITYSALVPAGGGSFWYTVGDLPQIVGTSS